MANSVQPAILAISGSYRQGGAVDQALEAALEGAREAGGSISLVHLADARIEFCRNCRRCMQTPGPTAGQCQLDDEMGVLLEEIRACDGLIVGAPVNFGDVNAITRQFLERCAPYAYWPWGGRSPQLRIRHPDRPALIVTSSAAPALLARFAFRGAGTLGRLARTLGFRELCTVRVGGVDRSEFVLPRRLVERARHSGRRLAENATQRRQRRAGRRGRLDLAGAGTPSGSQAGS